MIELRDGYTSRVSGGTVVVLVVGVAEGALDVDAGDAALLAVEAAAPHCPHETSTHWLPEVQNQKMQQRLQQVLSLASKIPYQQHSRQKRLCPSQKLAGVSTHWVVTG